MSRADAITRAREHFKSGEFLKILDRRVGYRTESQQPGSGEALRAYLVEDLQPAFAELDFTTRLIESPSGKGPYLLAEYREDARLPAARPTIFRGGRGGLRIHLDVNLRDGGHHSGNWGGVLANAATVLSNAIACLVNEKGQMQLDALKPPRISNAIRNVLADVKVGPTAEEAPLSPDRREDGL